MKSTKFNVVIPTFNREVELVRTIDSFQRALAGYDVEFYVINNSPKKLDLKFDDIIILNNKINGPCQARNLAVKTMRPCDWVWFADDDLYIFDDLGLRLAFESENADLINFRTFNEKGLFFKIKRLFSDDYRLFDNKVHNIFNVSGGNFICKYELAKDVEWDESFLGYSYGEDICFGLEVLRKSKYITEFNPSCVVYHYGENRKLTPGFLKKQLLGSMYIEKKYDIKHLNKKYFFVKVFLYGIFDLFNIFQLYRDNINKEYIEIIKVYNSLNEK